MTAKPHFFKEHFQKKDTASTYEATVGGCTRALAKDIISAYLGSYSLDGKVVLDNACGTGVVTKEVLLHAGIGNVKIDAADISPAMVEALGNSLSTTDAARATPVVMDAQELTYPDNTFDLSITNQGIMLLADPDKALAQLYRTTKPGGICYITSWNRLGHKDIATKVIKRLRGEKGQWDIPPNFWKEEWNDPAHLTSKLEQFGFKECAAEIKLEYIHYPAPEGFPFAVENLPKLYANWVTLKEGEEEPWGTIWEEELLPYDTSEGVKIPMWANIAWGKK